VREITASLSRVFPACYELCHCGRVLRLAVNFIPIKYSVTCTLILCALDLGFSLRSRVTPEDICSSLQGQGLVRRCQPGTPWAFEVVRHESQWMFEPTGSEIFKCYTVTDGVTHVPCTFKGVITQFATCDDLQSAIDQIQAQNHRNHDPNDLKANVTRADSTLEQYILYKLPRRLMLAVVPVTEDATNLRHHIDRFGTSEDTL
jgi:hypothetical protein